MRVALVLVAVLAAVVPALAYDLPRFDPNSGWCEYKASLGGPNAAAYRHVCIDHEQQGYKALKEEWPQVTPDEQSCAHFGVHVVPLPWRLLFCDGGLDQRAGHARPQRGRAEASEASQPVYSGLIDEAPQDRDEEERVHEPCERDAARLYLALSYCTASCLIWPSVGSVPLSVSTVPPFDATPV